MAYFVTIRDRSEQRTIFAAGPFNRAGDAENAVGWVRLFAHAKFSGDRDMHWASWGTARVKRGPLPAGRFNTDIGLPATGRIAETPLAPNRWWKPGEQRDLPVKAPQRRPIRQEATV